MLSIFKEKKRFLNFCMEKFLLLIKSKFIFTSKSEMLQETCCYTNTKDQNFLKVVMKISIILSVLFLIYDFSKILFETS